MRIFNRVVAWVYSLASLYVSAIFILMWVDQDMHRRFTGTFAEIEPNKFALVGLALLVLGAIWLVSSIEHHYRTRSVAFNGPGGVIRVHLTAIENMLTSEILRQVKAIKRVRTVALNTPKGLRIYNQLIIWSRFDIPSTVGKVQDLVRRLLQENIGVERVGEIRISVYHISQSDQPGSTEPEPDEPPPENPEIN